MALQLSRAFEKVVDEELLLLRHNMLALYHRDVSMLHQENKKLREQSGRGNGCLSTDVPVNGTPQHKLVVLPTWGATSPRTPPGTPRDFDVRTPRDSDARIESHRPMFQEAKCPTQQRPWEFDGMLKSVRYEDPIEDSPSKLLLSIEDSPSKLSISIEDSPSKLSVTRRWETLSKALIARMSKADLPHARTELHELWADEEKASWDALLRQKSTRHGPRCDRAPTDLSVCVGSCITGSSWMQRFIMHPDSNISMLNACLGGVIIGFDLVLFPLLFFLQVDSYDVTLMGWISTAYWTYDIPISFLTGYYHKGIVEMRPGMVSKHYLKTWFILDTVVVSSDWIGIVLNESESSSDQSNILRLSRILKYYRLLRVIRLLRLMKIVFLLKSYLDGFATEFMLVVVRLMGLILIVLMFSHYIACCWYYMAHSYEGNGYTWIVQAGLEDANKTYLYVVGLHWALCQFTPATNNIAPGNHGERVFSIFIVLFALIGFSSFLSSLTNALREMQKIYLDQHRGEAKIRAFLYSRKVPLEYARRIWQFYRCHYQKPVKMIRFDDLDILKKLPTPLRLSLRDHIYMPIVTSSTALACFSRIDYETLLFTCDTCLHEASFPNDHDVFQRGEAADFMYFLVMGSMGYSNEIYTDVTGEHVVLKIHAPRIISELAVWTAWVHCGILTCRGTCDFVKLDASRFRKAVIQRAHVEALRCMRKYGSLYVGEVNRSFARLHPVTDIVHPEDEQFHETLITLACKAFPGTPRSMLKKQGGAATGLGFKRTDESDSGFADEPGGSTMCLGDETEYLSPRGEM